MNIQDKLVKELVERRKAISITQRKLAELSGVSWDTIKNIEQKKYNGSIKSWTKLNKVLDTIEEERLNV